MFHTPKFSAHLVLLEYVYSQPKILLCHSRSTAQGIFSTGNTHDSHLRKTNTHKHKQKLRTLWSNRFAYLGILFLSITEFYRILNFGYVSESLNVSAHEWHIWRVIYTNSVWQLIPRNKTNELYRISIIMFAHEFVIIVSWCSSSGLLGMTQTYILLKNVMISFQWKISVPVRHETRWDLIFEFQIDHFRMFVWLKRLK